MIDRNSAQSSGSVPGKPRLLSRSERLLVLFFVLTLPLLNPWVRGDGVGYYAYARALLIQHDLDFAADYQHANTSFREGRVDEAGQVRSEFRTGAGYVENHFTIGPAILWSPFLITAHAGVLIARAFGSSVAADGFSAPYRFAMALGTAFYGFLALLISFRLARKFVSEQAALLATLAIWGGSSLAVYMYFNPSWSHAHSAFMVAAFVFYWQQTREQRSLLQWTMLGGIAGLMLDVYYANAMILLIVVAEALAEMRGIVVERRYGDLPRLIGGYALFSLALIVVFSPAVITKRIVYGSLLQTGYIPVYLWNWKSPVLLQVLFSANHGLFSWTPLLLFAFLGVFLFARKFSRIGVPLMCAVIAYYYFIASYPDWAGISSFGNRFFVSLTVFFILGLAVSLQFLAERFRSAKTAFAATSVLLFCFVAWNLGLMFQWGSHLIPARGPVSWSEVVHNQFVEVPRQLSGLARDYLFRRKDLMRRIEQRDVQQMKEQSTK